MAALVAAGEARAAETATPPGDGAVPAAVAIHRPSPGEVAHAREALGSFLERADPETKALVHKYPDLIAVRPPPRISGFPGTPSRACFYRLKNGEGTGFRPKAIMLLIGTNNIATCSAEEIAEGIGAVVFELRKDFPSSRILLLGIFPRGAPDDPARQTIVDINRRIAALDDGKSVHYLDIGAKFMASDGTLPPDIMPDKVHPSEKGLEIWGEAIKGVLEEHGGSGDDGERERQLENDGSTWPLAIEPDSKFLA